MWRRRLIVFLCGILLALLLLDAMLYWIDPLGLVDAVHSNHDFNRVMVDDATGYALPPGQYLFHYWHATILPDHSRRVPATAEHAACVIATIGDSMTFGYGVADDETWVNHIAQQWPTVRFTNPARPDYSAANVAELKAAYAADGYIWLLITNDWAEPYRYQNVRPAYPYPPASAIYRTWLEHQLRGTSPYVSRPTNEAAYWRAVERIATNDTLIFGFEDNPLAVASAARVPLVLLPAYQDVLSAVDNHPNAEGHRQIADTMLPALTTFVERICE